MDIRQLTYFTAIADAGSVTGAARELHMSQPPLSAQLRLLEEELGCLLFERNTRHLQLTEEGKALYARAAEILELCSSARTELRDRKAGKAGTLRLGAVTSISGTLFPALLREFHREFPAVRIELSENNTYELLDMVRSGRVEAALVRMPFSAADLQVTHLQNEPLCAAGRPEWFSGHCGEKVTLTELTEVPLLMYRRWKRILGDAFLQEGLRPNVFCVCDDARTAVRLAQEGFGVAVVPRSAVEVGRLEHACGGEKGRLECAGGKGRLECAADGAESGRLECAADGVERGSVQCQSAYKENGKFECAVGSGKVECAADGAESGSFECTADGVERGSVQCQSAYKENGKFECAVGSGKVECATDGAESGRLECVADGAESGRLECAADEAESGRLECAGGKGRLECAGGGNLKCVEAAGLSVWDIDDSKLCSEICTVCRKDQYISHAARNFLAIATEMLGKGK